MVLTNEEGTKQQFLSNSQSIAILCYLQNTVEASQELVSANLLQLFQSKKLAISPVGVTNVHLCDITIYESLNTRMVTIYSITHNHLVTLLNTYPFMLATLQQGQQYPFIFSINPRIRRFIFLQKLISLRTVAIATSCGVVTIIAPSGLVLVNIFIIDKCSSEVPGGVSTE